MPPTTRRRKRRLRTDAYRLNVSPTKGSGTVYVDGTQVTTSEGHPWNNSGFKGVDVGGDFYTISRKYGDGRREISDPQPQYIFGNPGDAYFYYGPLYAHPPSNAPGNGDNNYGPMYFPESNFPPDLSSSNAVLDGKGATAIANCKPTSSPANLSEAIGELMRDGIPHLIGHRLWESRAKDYRHYGDEYLNYQFGWLPLVNDVKSLASSIANGNDLMKQYERDAGRLVRRSYEFPLERTVSVSDLPFPEVQMASRPLFGGWYAGGSPTPGMKKTLEREIVRRTWFKGAFTYYLPSGYDSRNKLDRAALYAKQVLGLEITPETIWNLTPWSWAADWFGNIGDVAANVSDYISDGLVLRYGYLMEHTIIKDTYTLTGANLLRYGKRTFTNTFITEVKKRRRATPFGFGLNEANFTTRQKAIIAALGISRGPR